MTTRGIALAVGLTVPAAWLLWAERLDAGWQPVLATAGLWWLAAGQATWRVWLPAVVAVGALWLALPPRVPRRRGLRAPAAATPQAAAGPAAAGRLELTHRSPAAWHVLARTPEGAAALAAEQEAARAADVRPPEPAAAGAVGGDAHRSDPAPVPAGEGEAEAAGAADPPESAPETQKVPQELASGARWCPSRGP